MFDESVPSTRGLLLDGINGSSHFGDGMLDMAKMVFVPIFDIPFNIFSFLQRIKPGVPLYCFDQDSFTMLELA